MNLTIEDSVDPEREIIDTDHHLWRAGGLLPYVLEDLWEDRDSGHNIVERVFMECEAEYRKTGPQHLRAVAETEFDRNIALASPGQGKAEIAGIISHTGLDQNDAAVRDVFQAH